jgi:hypothetical protein
MTTQRHHHPPHLPLGLFEVEHPYARDWFLVAAAALAALLLLYWNR